MKNSGNLKCVTCDSDEVIFTCGCCPPKAIPLCQQHSLEHMLEASELPHTMTPVHLGNMTGAEADEFIQLKYKADLLKRQCDETSQLAELFVEQESEKIDNIVNTCINLLKEESDNVKRRLQGQLITIKSRLEEIKFD